MAQHSRSGTQDSSVSHRFGTVEFALKRHVSPHGRVTAVSMMKDEGPFVLEWVAHHLGLGFTDLLVYTNDCTDGTDEILIRLEELGLAHHRRNVIPEGLRPQPSALKHAQKEPLLAASDWVIVFDADEFLCIRHGDGSLDGLISSAKRVGGNGIVVTWRTFGSGGVRQWSRAPVTEQYLYAAPQMWNKGWGVKTLFQFDPDYWVFGIHRPKIKNKHLNTGFPDTVKWLNGSGAPMEDYFKFRGWRSIVRTVGYDWVQMNHYAVKSIDSYAMRKIRGNVNNKKDKYNSEYWALQDRNEIYDDTILRHRARCEEIVAELLTDPVLRRLHDRAVTQAEARLDAFRATPAYDALVRDLQAASEVPITRVSAKPPKPRDKARIEAQMSRIEAQRNTQSKSERRNSAHPDWGSSADLYMLDPTPSGTGPAPEVFVNSGVRMPADPHVFRPLALKSIVDGKFERNTARLLPRLLKPGMCYLELGAGVGFLPALIARDRPGVVVAAQEEIVPLARTAEQIWKLNGLDGDTAPILTTQPLIGTDTDAETAPQLTQLLSDTGCDVLFINHPLVSARQLATSLADAALTPSAVVLGARAMVGAMSDGDSTDVLGAAGYFPSEEIRFSHAMLLVPRRAT